jgi:hypothetical protein
LAWIVWGYGGSADLKSDWLHTKGIFRSEAFLKSDSLSEIPAGNLNESHHRAHRDHRGKSNEILCDLCVLCGVNFTEKFAIRFNLTTSG